MRHEIAVAALLPLLALLAAQAPGQALHVVSVRDHGAAGDGKTDDTQAFLDAVADAKSSGRHVYVARGRYLIGRPIELEDVGLTGPPVGAWPADLDALPVIVPTHRDGPAVRLLAGGSLRGVDITYEPDPPVENGPPAVLVSGVGAYVSNCKIMYAWDGIIADGSSNIGRLNIENVFMVAVQNVGVRVTGTWDVPALRNIEVWNNGPTPRPLAEGIGFLLGKNDLIRVTDCFAFAMRYGFLITDKIEGCEIEGGTWGILTGCSTDFCGTGVEVRGDNTVSISGGTFWDHAESLVVTGGQSRVRVSCAELKSNGAPAVVIRGCDHTVLTGCSVIRNMEGFDAPAVMFEGGRLVMQGNMIDALTTGIAVGPDVVSGDVTGNLVRAAEGKAITGESVGKARVLIEANQVEARPTA